jgi:hypothetical protein
VKLSACISVIFSPLVGDFLNQLELIGIVFETVLRVFLRDFCARHLAPVLQNFAHIVREFREVFFAGLVSTGEIEIIVEAVIYGGTYGRFRMRIALLELAAARRWASV